MTTTAIRLFIAAAVFCAAGHAVSQNGERASTPPGRSHDGAAPSDGAIKGGTTILPGESAGIPDRAKNVARCDELLGTLREECLAQERKAAAGGTKAPADASESRPRSPEPAD